METSAQVGALPKAIDGQLVEGHSVCCAFNRRGTLLAVGCLDGRNIIWDFEVRAVARILVGHIHPVTSVSWSRNGKLLLSSSTDWNLLLWDVLTGKVIHKIGFQSPLLNAEIHVNGNSAIVSPLMEWAAVIDLKNGSRKPLPVITELIEERKDLPLALDYDNLVAESAKRKVNLVAVAYNRRYHETISALCCRTRYIYIYIYIYMYLHYCFL